MIYFVNSYTKGRILRSAQRSHIPAAMIQQIMVLEGARHCSWSTAKVQDKQLSLLTGIKTVWLDTQGLFEGRPSRHGR